MSVRALSKAKAMAVNSAQSVENKEKFRVQLSELVEKSLDDQSEFFMKSFIFALGDDWKQVSLFIVALPERVRRTMGGWLSAVLQ